MYYWLKSNPNKIAAVVVWLLGLGATYNFLSEYQLSYAASVGGSILLQVLLTYLEHLVWVRGFRGFETIGWVALLIDGFINFGGVYPITSRLHTTASYTGVAQALNLEQGSVPSLVAFLLAVALAVLLCASPEKLWTMQYE